MSYLIIHHRERIFCILKQYRQSSLFFRLFIFIYFYFLLSDIELLINIRQEMIGLPMACLISPNAQNHISEGSSFRKEVILDCLLSCRLFIPMIERAIFPIDGLQHGSVCLDCFFFKISNKSMTEFGVEDVRDEKRVHENALNSDNHRSFQNSRPSKVQEGN